MTLEKEKGIIKLLVASNLIFIGLISIPHEFFKIGELYREQRETKSIRNDLEKKYALILNLEADANSSKKYLDRLDKSIPSDESLDTFLSEITDYASKSGFLISSLTSQSKAQNDGFTTINITVNLAGNPNDLPVFLDLLEKGQRIVQVNTVRYDADSKGSDITVSLDTYFRPHSFEILPGANQ